MDGRAHYPCNPHRSPCCNPCHGHESVRLSLLSTIFQGFPERWQTPHARRCPRLLPTGRSSRGGPCLPFDRLLGPSFQLFSRWEMANKERGESSPPPRVEVKLPLARKAWARGDSLCFSCGSMGLRVSFGPDSIRGEGPFIKPCSIF